jgi:hypothetical protein
MPIVERALGGLLAVTLALLVGCGAGGEANRIRNVRPPRAGIPAGPADVEGIYRSVHQALLQLRGDGTVVLVVPRGGGPSEGRYSLHDGQLEVRTNGCGPVAGTYDAVVTGEQKAGKATLHLTARQDACAERFRALTRDPWVYANS